MAKDAHPQATASLRALTYRITSTPAKQLPYIAPQFAASLGKCRSILSTPADALKATSEASQTVNRFRSTISQLLQARTVEERWAATVLAKAALEAGGTEAVAKASGWAKSLIAILKKNDPSATKCLAIITLTRLFMLSWTDANLVREITTPALPGFVQACLAAVERPAASANVLQTALEAFLTLVPRHPTIFRTFETQIRGLLLRIISSTASSGEKQVYHTTQHRESSRQLFTLLHHCAPKQGGPEKWNETFRATVTAAHATCDRIFRSVKASWTSSAGITATRGVSSGELESMAPDAVGCSPWHGMDAGAERLVELLRLLQAHMECATSSAVVVRVGLALDLVDRLLALDFSTRNDSSSFNSEIPKDERDALFAALPSIHTAALELTHAILRRFGHSLASVLPHMLEMVTGIFAAESGDDPLRATAYRLQADLLRLIGPSLSKNNVADMAPIMRACCEGLLPVGQNGTSKQPQSSAAGTVAGKGESHGFPPSLHASSTRIAAENLLPLLFSEINAALVPSSLRARMDQTALLTRNKDALVASVFNPPSRSPGTKHRSSLLPLLAREFPECPEVEALLRPRMPLLGAGVGAQQIPQEGGDEEAESEDESEMNEDVVSMDHDSDNDKVGDDVATSVVAGADELGREEVFSTAPEHLSYPEAQTLPLSNKRPAKENGSPNGAIAKKLRASPVAAAIAPTAEPGVAATPQADLPVTTVVEDNGGKRVDVLPDGGKKEDVGMDGDDSDMEIPPLTMESDSDEEE